MVSIILKDRIKKMKGENKGSRREEMSLGIASSLALRLKDRQLSRGRGAQTHSSNFCLSVECDEAIL